MTVMFVWLHYEESGRVTHTPGDLVERDGVVPLRDDERAVRVVVEVREPFWNGNVRRVTVSVRALREAERSSLVYLPARNRTFASCAARWCSVPASPRNATCADALKKSAIG